MKDAQDSDSTPPFTGREYWIMQVGFWSLFLLTLTVTVLSGPPAIAFDKMSPEMADAFKVVFTSMKPVMWIHNLAMTLCGLLATHRLHLLTLKRRWDRLPLGHLVPVVIPTCALFSFVMSLLINSVRAFALRPSFGINAKGDGLLVEYLSTTMITFFLLGMWATLYFACHAFTRLHEIEVSTLRSQAAIKESRLQTIATQLNPHFLFNALNTVRALIDQCPEQARDAVTQLSLVLRASLTSCDQKLIPVSDELKVVNALLDLEIARHGDRLAVFRELGENCHTALMPPLLFVTLIENAVKHGVACKLGPGHVNYRIFRDGQRIGICVRNSGSLATDWQTKDGLGLSHTRERLALLYGEQATLSIHQNSDGVEATVYFPCSV